VSAVAEEIGARALIRKLGDCFEARGWSDPDNLALDIVESAQRAGVDLAAAPAARRASPSFLARNAIERNELELAIEGVFEGRVLVPAHRDYPLIINNNTFRINGDGNVITNVNLGGNQYNLTNESSTAEVLEAVGDLVAEGLGAGLSPEALGALERYVETRPDIDQTQIEAAVRAQIKKAASEPGALTRLRDGVAAGTTTSLLVKGILAVLAAL
jgi:hypothetical protein